jgi:hypothetical protein
MSTAVGTRAETQKGSWALWARLRGAFGRMEDAGGAFAPPVAATTQREPEASSAVALDGAERGKLLKFPIHGEALLVRLAELLRKRTGGMRPGHDPLQLTMSRRPAMRLSIDDSAYVEFAADISLYRVDIMVAPDTRLVLETGDFDTVVNFVVQYVGGCRLEPASLVAAS